VFVAVVVGCSVAGLAGLLVAGVCWFRSLQNHFSGVLTYNT